MNFAVYWVWGFSELIDLNRTVKPNFGHVVNGP